MPIRSPFRLVLLSAIALLLAGMLALGGGATPTHYRGPGGHDRDQHLVTSVNTQTVEEWEASFGEVYRRVFAAGAKSVMVGHIALPEYSKLLRPGIADEDILPASMAPEILTDLLRGRLGFNGVICSDALSMVGFTIPMPRSKALPFIIEAGTDVLLFANNYARDVASVHQGIADGTLSMRRLDEAVTRTLALKASLGLHRATPEQLVPGVDAFDALPLDEHRAWSLESAQQAITLVKHKEAGVLPLDVATHKRVLVYYTEDSNPNHHKIAAGAARITNGHCVAQQLRAAGFEATLFERDGRPSLDDVFAGRDAVGYDDLLANYDLVLYVAQYEPAS
jgi:beta-N-acetylhexosaminidase